MKLWEIISRNLFVIKMGETDGQRIYGAFVVQLEQIRTIDKRRIDNYLGKVTPREMVAIEKALSVSLAMEQLKKRSTKHKPKKEKE